MNCHNAKLKMDDRLAGCLSEAEQAEMDRHFDQCDSCRKVWAEECKLWGVTGNYPEPPKVSSNFTANVMASVRAASEAEQAEEKIIAFPVRKRRWVPVAIAAGLTVLLTGVYLVRFTGIEEGVQVAESQPVETINDGVITEDMTADEMIIANLDVLEDLELLENLEFYEDLDVIEALAAN
jgi:hypothetical protein